MTKLLALALALSAAVVLAGCQKQDAAFGEKVRAYLLEHPEVIEEAIVRLNTKKEAEAANLAKAALTTHRDALERDPRDFVANPGGRITVVEFFDYRCGYCKASAPEIATLIAQNPDVRFVFKEFPIFGGDSDLAAKVALTPAAKARGLDVFKAFMGEKVLNAAAIDRNLTRLGVDPALARRQGASAEVAKHLSDTRQLAQSLGIEGTPAFVVGDQLISGADIPALRAAITDAKAGGAKRAM